MTGPFRIYTPDECGPDGYPLAWHRLDGYGGGIKDLVREQGAHRCVRCRHPYRVGRDGIMEPVAGGRLARDLGIDPRALDLGFEIVADRDGLLDDIALRTRRRHWSPCERGRTHGTAARACRRRRARLGIGGDAAQA
ncbi:MAG: hypothetical protein ACYCQK_01900 [Acidiferrobacteraceae bacterium]